MDKLAAKGREGKVVVDFDLDVDVVCDRLWAERQKCNDVECS